MTVPFICFSLATLSKPCWTRFIASSPAFTRNVSPIVPTVSSWLLVFLRQARLLCLLGPPSSLAESPKGKTLSRSPLALGRLIASPVGVKCMLGPPLPPFLSSTALCLKYSSKLLNAESVSFTNTTLFPASGLEEYFKHRAVLDKNGGSG